MKERIISVGNINQSLCKNALKNEEIILVLQEDTVDYLNRMKYFSVVWLPGELKENRLSFKSVPIPMKSSLK